MEKNQNGKPPWNTAHDCPAWFNPYGRDMALLRESSDQLTIATPGDIKLQHGCEPELVIRLNYNDRNLVNLSFSILVRDWGDWAVHGKLPMPIRWFAEAFNVSLPSLPVPPRLASQYGFHTAAPGMFGRYGSFLILPPCGSGEIGDPSLSLFLSEKIIRAVEKFIQQNAPKKR